MNIKIVLSPCYFHLFVWGLYERKMRENRKSGFYCSWLVLEKLSSSDFRDVQLLEDGGIKFLQNVSVYQSTSCLIPEYVIGSLL
jgi:hypothetical protein